jgi:hypothetical protein
MAEQEEPEFDPATWTPDKPWPKGYYKPVLGLVAATERIDRVAGEGAGFRRLLWGLTSLPLQALGLAIATFGSRANFGLLHVMAETLTPVPAFLFFALLLPALLFVGIVCDPGSPGAAASPSACSRRWAGWFFCCSRCFCDRR